MQANEEQKILVFVDEINALLEGNHAYGPFLAPLEEGIYVRRGKFFSLRPCVWVFAGTRLESDQLDKGEKLSDFKSRMTIIERLDFASLKGRSEDTNRLQRQARLEQVYLGATMIRRSFTDVREVSLEILEKFYSMDPEAAPARKIRRLAAALRNVQYGRVSRDNCTVWGEMEEPLPEKPSKESLRPVRLHFSA
jgi:hypothetical protein